MAPTPKNHVKYNPYYHLLADEKTPEAIHNAIVQHADRAFVHSLSEIGYNTLLGNVPLTPTQKSKLKKFRRDLYLLVDKGTPITLKRKLLRKKKGNKNQRGGFLATLLPALLGPFVSLLGTLIK